MKYDIVKQITTLVRDGKIKLDSSKSAIVLGAFSDIVNNGVEELSGLKIIVPNGEKEIENNSIYAKSMKDDYFKITFSDNQVSIFNNSFKGFNIVWKENKEDNSYEYSIYYKNGNDYIIVKQSDKDYLDNTYIVDVYTDIIDKEGNIKYGLSQFVPDYHTERVSILNSKKNIVTLAIDDSEYLIMANSIYNKTYYNRLKTIGLIVRDKYRETISNDYQEIEGYSKEKTK